MKYCEVCGKKLVTVEKPYLDKAYWNNFDGATGKRLTIKICENPKCSVFIARESERKWGTLD